MICVECTILMNKCFGVSEHLVGDRFARETLSLSWVKGKVLNI